MEIEKLDTQFKNIQPAVIAFFSDRKVLEKTLDDLKMKNFKNEDISILTVKRKDLDKNIIEGAATGLVTGIAEGGILGWLAGLSLIAIPGAGTFIAAGPFISAIAGAAIGANVGSITGALIGFGVGQIEAEQLEKYIKDKGVIIAVHVNDPAEQLAAKKVMEAHGAIKVFDPLEKKTPPTLPQKQFDTELIEG